MNQNLKHSLTLLWIAVILISGYKLFSAHADKALATEDPSRVLENVEAERALFVGPPPELAPEPEPTIIIQERVATQTRVVTETIEIPAQAHTSEDVAELAQAKQELRELKVALDINAQEFYPAIMDVKRISTEGNEATRSVSQMKLGVSKLRTELAEVVAEIKAYKERKEFTSDFPKNGEKGLNERHEILIKEITQAKQALSEKEAQVVALKTAYDKANSKKLRLHRERLEHTAWQKTLNQQIKALQASKDSVGAEIVPD